MPDIEHTRNLQTGYMIAGCVKILFDTARNHIGCPLNPGSSNLTMLFGCGQVYAEFNLCGLLYYEFDHA